MENVLQNLTLENIVSVASPILLALLVIIIGFYVAGAVSRLIKKRIEASEMDSSLAPFLSSLVSVLLKILVLVSAASTLGMEVASFAAIIAAAGFAIGMALQGSLANFAGGVMILTFKPFKVGDVITAQGFTAVVDQIQVFNTVLRTFDNQIITVPNGQLSNSPITNINRESTRRVDLAFGVGYDSDIDKVREVLKSVVDRCPHLMEDKDVAIVMTELADSSINFAVRLWTQTPNYWDVYFFMLENVKKEFDAANINIPYPTMDVNINQPTPSSL